MALPSTGLVLHLKANAIAGLLSGDPVAAWTATVGTTPTQSTGANKPIYLTNQINSWPAVRFDGVNDYLSCGDNHDLGTNSLTIFMVMKRTQADGTPIAKTVAAVSPGRWGWTYLASGSLYGGVYETAAGVVKINDNAAAAAVDTDFKLYELHVDRQSGVMNLIKSAVLQNSKTFTPDNATSINNAFALNIGAYDVASAGLYFGGDVAEIAMYLRGGDVITTDLTDARAYFNDKYFVRTFPTYELSGVRWRHWDDVPKDYSSVTDSYEYEDGGRDFNVRGAPPKVWNLDRTGATKAQTDIFDAFWDSVGTSTPFVFTDKYGTTWTNVRIQSYSRSHEAHKSWSRTLAITLVKYS